MSSNAKKAFEANKADIDRLWSIHAEVAGSGPGRKHDVEVINRSAIVFVTACWEAYVEDVALEAFDYLLANAASAEQIPNKVRAAAVTGIVDSADRARRVWKLADTGWRKVLGNHRATVKATWVESLNTPKRRQVDALFKNLLGLSSISSHWPWRGMSAESAGKKLDKFITVRGDIAHRLKYNLAVSKGWGTSYLDHVVKLVEKTDQATAKHVKKTVGSAPW